MRCVTNFKFKCLYFALIPIFLINNLLFQDYNAKLSDFGLAKDAPEGDKTHVSTRVMGTYGYAAPEYVMTGWYHKLYVSYFFALLCQQFYCILLLFSVAFIWNSLNPDLINLALFHRYKVYRQS